MNPVSTQSGLTNLSKDPSTEDFDLQAGQSWIYPTNYPVREYQYNIIQEALLKNTLVSLPTGLGKTFIAAVIMYNFYRWYPFGKIIFMAPTRPLVKQQIDACYDIMAIPKESTAELTGTKGSSIRADIWKEKRVFYVTPQVLQNDLDSIMELGNKIKCLVFDEAHKAKGNHAYCEVIRKLSRVNKYFRVLALSATPGNNINDMAEVMKNLQISHVELRSEESSDVKPYVFQRSLETVVVPLGEKLHQIREEYIKVLEKYTKILIRHNIIKGNVINLTKGKIFMTMKDFQQKTRGTGSSNYSEIMRSLNICVTLYHAFELLVRHGLRSFLAFFDEHIEKPLLRGNIEIMQIMEDVRSYLGPPLAVEQLPDGTFTEVSPNVKFGHPKFYKLQDILVSHFTETKESSRVIVFFEYRESVMEAHALLLKSRPLVKPRIFLGQGSGITQKVQINVVKSFREGTCNTLLSTCIGEEGLDVGEVNLIVCFDISNKSPIRMIQRMGRTGRKKEGQIIVLITEGKEQQTLKDCLMHKQNLGNLTFFEKELNKNVSIESPRLVPWEITPKCEKMYITVKKPKTAKNNNLKEMFRSISSGSSEVVLTQELEEIKDKIPATKLFFNEENPLLLEINMTDLLFTKKLEKQRSFQPTSEVKHSKASEFFVSLLQLADSKRFNIPITQMPTMASQCSQNKFLKQGDIRNMFLRPTSSNENELLSQVSETARSTSLSNIQIVNSEPKKDDNSTIMLNQLHSEISNFLLLQMPGENNCRFCGDMFDCLQHKIFNTEKIDFNTFILPDTSIIEIIQESDLIAFTKSLTNTSLPNDVEMVDLSRDDSMDTEKHSKKEFCDSSSIRIEDFLGDMDISKYENENKSVAKINSEKSFSYQAPNNFSVLLDKYKTSIIDTPEDSQTIPHNSKSVIEKNFTPNPNLSLELFDETLNDFIQSSPVIDSKTLEDLLSFFKLKSLEDMFVNEQNSQETIIYSQSPDIFEASPVLSVNKMNKHQKSPSLLSESINTEEDGGSPVLNRSIERSQQLKNKARRNLLNTSYLNESKVENTKIAVRKPNLGKLKQFGSKNIESPSKFSMNETKLSSTPKSKICILRSVVEDKNLEDINDFCDLSEFGIPTKTNEINKTIENRVNLKSNDETKDLDIDDFCDLSVFNITQKKLSQTVAKNGDFKKDLIANIDDINDFCDLSDFGISTNTNKGCEKTTETHKTNDVCDLSGFGISKNTNKVINKTKKTHESNVIDLCDLSDFGISKSTNKVTNKSMKPHESNINEFCDLSDFGISNKSVNQTGGTGINVNDFCNLSDFGISKNTNKVSDKTTQNVETNANEELDIDDFCDLSIFNITQKVSQKALKAKELNIKMDNSEIINISSDIHYTPSKVLNTNHHGTQYSITQMLSLVNKGDDKNKASTSQKENILKLNATHVEDDLNDFEDFSFTFNNRKKVIKKNKVISKPSSSKCSLATIKTTNVSNNNSYLDRSLNVSNSDDEFEQKSTSPVWIKPKDVKIALKNKKVRPVAKPKATSRIKTKMKTNEFIHCEAELSDDENVFVSQDESDDEQDGYDASFVADETQHFESTQMHAHYLQSIRSPANRGKFKIPSRPKHNITNVFSQQVNQDDDTYLDDSFVVHSQEMEEAPHELSELEILEMKLKEKKRKKKRKLSEEKTDNKRRRIICMSDDSD